jgi:hypothetical protein
MINNYPMNLQNINNQMILNYNQIMLQANNNNPNFFMNNNNNYNYNNQTDIMNLIKEISQKIKYINFNNQIQINDLIMQLSMNSLEDTDNIDDPLYYVNEPKKIIRFVYQNKILKREIPNSITKFDLYTIAYPITCTNSCGCNIDYFVLIHKNIILEKDESPIDNIINGDLIIIIEEKRYPDESFYNKIIEKYKNKKFNQIVFDLNSKKHSIALPENIKFDEMKKAVFSKLHLNEKQFKLIRYATYSSYNYRIDEVGEMCRHVLFGKKIKAFFMYKNKEMNVNIGTLNSIKSLILNINNTLGDKKAIRIGIGMNKFGKNDEKSLSSIGINKDFKCSLEF